jgi:phosphate/phosphite/phosphonate ABC transporter binding protein
VRALLVCSVLLAKACTDEASSYLPAPPKQDRAAQFAFSLPPDFQRLRIGLVPYINPDELRAAHAPLAAYLTDQLKVPVELVMGDNYDDVGERLARGEVDLVEFSPYSFVRAERNFKLRPLATVIADGSQTAAGYIVVRQDSARRTLEDLKGASFGFVDPASTSGYLYPVKLLKDRGIDPATAFSRTEFLGNHEAVLLAVLSGKVDAGATFQGSIAQLKRSKNIDPLSFRIIAKTPRIPRDLFCVRADFSPEIGNAILQLLTRLSSRDPKGREILDPLDMNGFLPANDRLYDGVRAAAASVAENPR